MSQITSLARMMEDVGNIFLFLFFFKKKGRKISNNKEDVRLEKKKGKRVLLEATLFWIGSPQILCCIKIQGKKRKENVPHSSISKTIPSRRRVVGNLLDCINRVKRWKRTMRRGNSSPNNRNGQTRVFPADRDQRDIVFEFHFHGMRWW